MTVGNLSSDERGTGARFNSGKAPMQYVPLGVLNTIIASPRNDTLTRILSYLCEFEQGRDSAVNSALVAGREYLYDAARVFEFGAQKYSAWNWAKGMAWSVPLACVKRHALAIADGEENDPESGLPHMGHLLCNVIMLHHFVCFYPEGDDRPPAARFRREEDGEA